MENNQLNSPDVFDEGQGKGTKILFEAKRYTHGLALCTIYSEDKKNELASFVCAESDIKNHDVLMHLVKTILGKEVKPCK